MRHIDCKFAPDLIAVAGFQFSQQVGTFLICNGQHVQQYGTRIYWGDGGDDPMSVIGPFFKGKLKATHTFSHDGVINISGHVQAVCYGKTYGNPGPVAFPDLSCGKGKITVYESIQLKSFSVTCGAVSPCKTAVGGSTTINGTVSLKQASAGTGAFVSTSIAMPSSLGSTEPYLIIKKGLDSGTFTISTSKVARPTPLLIVVHSGGVTLSQRVMITPK